MMAARWRRHLLVALALWAGPAAVALAADPAVERGKYLATISGCGDCHTPGYFLGRPDPSRELAGSDVGFEVRDLGFVYGPNLTMDKETGLGSWTDAQIAAALTTGVRPDGRKLAPIMPWRNLAALTKPDVDAIIAYLRSLPPVKNKTPGPYGPAGMPTSFVMRLVPPESFSTSIQLGSTLAERWCKGCHAVERNPAAPTTSGPPSFTTIAAKPAMTPEALDKFLSSGHTRMPNFALAPYERSLLIAFIQSMR